MTQGKFRWTSILVMAVIVAIPLLEIWVIVQLGAALGVWWTVALLLGIAALGLALVVWEGRRTWRALLEAVGQGEMPTREMTDGMLVMLGGLLLVFPGLVSDVLGLICLVPFTRPLPRKLMERWARSRGVETRLRMNQTSTVIPGSVVEDDHARPDSPGDDNPPPALEGRIIG